MLGQITIGDYSVIGANAVCLRRGGPPPPPGGGGGGRRGEPQTEETEAATEREQKEEKGRLPENRPCTGKEPGRMKSSARMSVKSRSCMPLMHFRRTSRLGVFGMNARPRPAAAAMMSTESTLPDTKGCRMLLGMTDRKWS